MKDYPISIIIPTFNNPEYLFPCISSLLTNQTTAGMFEIIVINNGDKLSIDQQIRDNASIRVYDAQKNLGWEGGLKQGLLMSKSPFVVFMNDDTYVPPASRLWLNHLIELFRDPTVGAVGPSSNVVMGRQNIFIPQEASIFETTSLIGFCMMVRREAVEKAGGIDDTLPGGDDLDISIRLRQQGYRLLVHREAFIFHHGFKTGERLFGSSVQSGGWNSYEQYHTTNTALIKKHGFRAWFETMRGVIDRKSTKEEPPLRNERDVIASLEVVADEKKAVLDLGCGGEKTVPHAVGVDIVPKGTVIHTLAGAVKSQADVVADVSGPLPFKDGSVDTIIARHILEHVVDPIATLKNWKKILKSKGYLIIAVPDQGLHSTIPMNSEHLHAWDGGAMVNLLTTVGFKNINIGDTGNRVSFIASCQKA